MTNEAERMLAEALRKAKISGGFSPVELGASIGLNRPQAEAAARALSNAGILVLGFDFAAHFSPAYRKANSPNPKELVRKKKARKASHRSAKAAVAV